METALFEDDGRVPNSRLPTIIYRSAIEPDENDPASAFERKFAQNDWRGSWRWSIFTFHHYHSTSHEVLGIAVGHATLRLGGRKGREFEVRAGDVIALPAGTGHKRVASSPGFLVVGAYPEGRERDLIKPYAASRSAHDAALARIAAVPAPKFDPVQGREGAVARLWKR
ncbi:MAG: cupin [Hyphomicrobiales bacterium]|nr:cupin [Hyphomicrobiales bacterium]MBV9433173.1 cupin [Hyphomicrobiales bacterium]MBW0004053.1 cupin [Hyphomicrobiales bacterium]